MAIRTEFGQIMIGSRAEDVSVVLSGITTPPINLVTAYYPPQEKTLLYCRNLDVENRFIKAGVGSDSGYGRDVAHFTLRDGALIPDDRNVLPQNDGYDVFCEDIRLRAEKFSEATGQNGVRAMIRVLPASKNNVVVHIDNKVGYRGLQTLMGEEGTLFLPDCYVDMANWYCEYNEEGELQANGLSATFSELQRLGQIEEHHMSIHKGNLFKNPLFHSAPGNCPELKFASGTRVLLTLDH